MPSVAFSKACSSRSVTWREATTESSAGCPKVIGPAELSRSSWRASASLVAWPVISVSSFMWSSWLTLSSELWMRRPPSVVAATTGSASSETSRVRMLQLRSAMREACLPCCPPVVGGWTSPLAALPAGFAARAPVAESPTDSPLLAAGPDWAALTTSSACGRGSGPRPAPPRGSGSPAAPPSLLKRPCTSVATSGPGVPRAGGGTVSSLGARRPRDTVDRRVPVHRRSTRLRAPACRSAVVAAVRGIPAQARNSNKVPVPSCDKGYAMQPEYHPLSMIMSQITDFCPRARCADPVSR